MPTTQTKLVPFGPTYTGLVGTVGYAVYNPNGTPYAARTTAGIVEAISGSGVYVASVTVPNGAGVLIVWDTGGSAPIYRVDESNPKYGGSPPATATVAKAVAFGPLYTGLVGTVGLKLENGDGSPYAARTTAGIVELVAGTGIYASSVTVPTTAGVGLLWDTGGTAPIYANDQSNPYHPLVTAATFPEYLQMTVRLIVQKTYLPQKRAVLLPAAQAGATPLRLPPVRKLARQYYPHKRPAVLIPGAATVQIEMIPTPPRRVQQPGRSYPVRRTVLLPGALQPAVVISRPVRQVRQPGQPLRRQSIVLAGPVQQVPILLRGRPQTVRSFYPVRRPAAASLFQQTTVNQTVLVKSIRTVR